MSVVQTSTTPVPRRRELSVDDYYTGVRGGEIAILARALTLIESTRAGHQVLAEQLLSRLMAHTGRSIRVGITGAPGAGKSTLIEALGLYLVGSGKRVAVLAIDPSSGVTGGSILGDKTRMARLANESKAFIRPSPSAGTLGGVARRTRESMLVCEAAGYDVVLIETVGVGQSETMVADMTDCFLALMIPGHGSIAPRWTRSRRITTIRRPCLRSVRCIARALTSFGMRWKSASERESSAASWRPAGRSRVRGGSGPPSNSGCSASFRRTRRWVR